MPATEMTSRVFVVIAAYNEAMVIRDVLRGLQESGDRQVIVVDDGSADETYKLAREVPGVVVLRHYINRGKGAAIKTGIEAAKKLGAAIVITMDGDGQHDPHDIAQMERHLSQGYDVVLGTRMKNPRGMPLLKLLANTAGNMITWALHGLWVTDSQSGFRAYSRLALECIETRTNRYEYDSEVIREIQRHHLRYIEMPITVLYTKYSQSKSDKQGLINGLKTFFKMLVSH